MCSFSGTWVWAAHLVGAIRDFAGTRKGIVLWTHPGSQGWRPVGGLVLHGGLKEVDLTAFVYGPSGSRDDIEGIVSYCRASHEVSRLNMSTIGSIGGRGMGQTCEVADPSQWMRVFGVDIDSRDTTELIRTADGFQGTYRLARSPPAAAVWNEPARSAEMSAPSASTCIKEVVDRTTVISTRFSRSRAWATITARPASRRA